jgi:hypothetical protein
MPVEPVILTVVVGCMATVKSMLRCVEILILAQADNMRERTRRATILSIMAAMQASETQIASFGEVESMGPDPHNDGTPNPAADDELR